MRISDWSSDVCSSDLLCLECRPGEVVADEGNRIGKGGPSVSRERQPSSIEHVFLRWLRELRLPTIKQLWPTFADRSDKERSEERRVGKECVSTCSFRGTA